MSLDWRVCSRARLARDARFDGKFFIGVLTTRIYCRPVCRGRTSQEKNVRYFPSAAAAAEAGFRPCLRCRPECSPGTPASSGTKNTVSRALRLISEAGLEDGGVEGLASQLGVGSRHLRRLFLRHLGATPSAVAQTRRLQFSKKLIDETNLRMTQIAIAAGFGSVRSFNAAIRKVYKRTPTQIRGLVRRKEGPGRNQYLFQLNYRAPYDWNRMLAFLASWATPGVEIVEDGSYRRSISVNGEKGYLEVSRAMGHDALAVKVEIGDSQALFPVVERVRAMFDVDADWPMIAKVLVRDAILGPRIKSYPGLRVPGCWNGFELAVRALLCEEANAAKAKEVAGRMASEFGEKVCFGNGITHLFPIATILADADLRQVGLTRDRADAIQQLARAVRDGRIRFEGITDAEKFLVRLAAVREMSESTVQWVALRALREPDAFPSGDRTLRSALNLNGSHDLEKSSETWRPWRAYAAIYLWSFAEEFQQGVTERSIGRGTSYRRSA